MRQVVCWLLRERWRRDVRKTTSRRNGRSPLRWFLRDWLCAVWFFRLGILKVRVCTQRASRVRSRSDNVSLNFRSLNVLSSPFRHRDGAEGSAGRRRQGGGRRT